MTSSAQDAKPSRDRVLAYLESMRAKETGMMNVTASEGEYLSNLAKKLNAKRVLEIGTSNGYSGIWLGLALRETGGKLTTLDIDEGRRARALKNFQAAGFTDMIDSRLTDALKETAKLEGPFDLVFIDAGKQDYIKYLHLVLPKVRKGGAIVAHNVLDYPHLMEDFLQEIKTSPALKTEIVDAGGPGGFSVSYKK